MSGTNDPLDEVREKFDLLVKRGTPADSEVLQELATVLEELHVAMAELTVQNEELISSRQMADAQRRRYQELFDFAPDGYFVTTDAGMITEANNAASSLIGVKALIGKPMAIYVPFNKRDALYALLREFKEKDVQKKEAEIEFKPRNGRAFSALMTVGAIRDSDGELTGLRWLIRDITESKRQQQLLANHARRLAASNAELEQWTSVTAHDLREPVRVMAIYSGLLNESLGKKITKEEETHLNFISNAAQKTLSLIEDLLSFATITGKQADIAEIDVKRVVDTALESLKPALRECDGEVVCGKMPKIYADQSQLTKLFYNLIHNAIKFHSHRPLKIKISAKKDGDAWIFSVSDNGIGFEMEYADRIFVMFERLAESSYEGNGIGLALCKKLVEHQGGKVWAKSKIDKGSTFFFSLPPFLIDDVPVH